MWLADGTGRAPEYVMEEMSRAFPGDLMMQQGQLRVKTQLATAQSLREEEAATGTSLQRDVVMDVVMQQQTERRRFDFSRHGMIGLGEPGQTMDAFNTQWSVPRAPTSVHPVIRLSRGHGTGGPGNSSFGLQAGRGGASIQHSGKEETPTFRQANPLFPPSPEGFPPIITPQHGTPAMSFPPPRDHGPAQRNGKISDPLREGGEPRLETWQPHDWKAPRPGTIAMKSLGILKTKEALYAHLYCILEIIC